ncbi:uncharacterized protein LOC115228949 [Argonauta hians]
MSQVPKMNVNSGNRMNIYDGKSSRPYYKDTDSDYVRLAKERGVKDLLKHQDTANNKGAVPYDKVNWFYLEDNAAEDAKKSKDMNWTFDVPDYMCNVPSDKSNSSETKQEDKTSRYEESDTKPVITKAAGLNRKPENHGHPFIFNYETTADHNEKEEAEKEISTPNSENASPQVVKAIAHTQQWKNPITQAETSNDGLLRTAGKKCCSRENACTSMSKLLSFGYANNDASGELKAINMKP